MRLASWMFLLGMTIGTAEPVQAAAIKGRWLGQDRHDYCGKEGSTVEPNGVQDIHIALGGLPPRQAIVYASVKGHGSGEWRFGEAKNQFAAVIVRKPNSTTADIFFEPFQVETGREFSVQIKFDSGETTEIYLKGGKADTSLRMPEASIAAKWGGQTRDDFTGLGPSVGPDGQQDAYIALARLPKGQKIKSITLESASTHWTFGLNPERHNNAELILSQKDVTEGRLYFQPDSDLGGQKLKLTLQYENGKGDTATILAGRVEPKLAVQTTTLPKRVNLPIKSRWIGQDGHNLLGRGDVHLQLSGIPRNKVVGAAVLSDSVRKTWVYRAGDRIKLDIEPEALPLAYQATADRAEADLYFSPYRDETANTLTLRLVFLDGDVAFVTIPGGPCDPAKRAPDVAPSKVTARPGDDLNKLANLHGTVRLAKGDYRLGAPLVLKQPVKLVGEPGSVLWFSQDASQPPWTTAIKFHSGGTTLQGFAIRFDTPIRWRADVGWGPAVIGSTDSFDTEKKGPKPQVAFIDLDIETPPQNVKLGTWEDTPKLMRLLDVEGGTISGNKLRGGVIEFFGGPWKVENNEHRGTLPGTSTQAVFAVHDPFDLVLKDNKAKPVGPSGKTWRFVVLTNNGQSDRVEGNRIEGVGPRDDDTIPSANAPEIILTESYRIRFEGKAAAVSPDGRMVRLPHLLAESPRTGDMVSVVAGKGAGEFRRVAQRIEPNVVYLDEALPKGSDILLVGPGFVDEVFARNVIEAPGGTAAAGFVLAGNHFRTKLLDNKIRGAGDAFLLTAYPTESPGIWGWSHAPFLGGLIEGNTLEDSERGGRVGVMHSRYTKTTRGRLYLTANLVNNTIVWSNAFLARPREGVSKGSPVGLTIGFENSGDATESRIVESRTSLRGGSPTARPLRVHASMLNGKAVVDQTLAIPRDVKSVDSAKRADSSSAPRR